MSDTIPTQSGSAVSSEEAVFGFAEHKAIVSDLFRPNIYLYWADLLISLTIAYGFAGLYFLSPTFSAQQIIGFIISGFALHRVANFIHELAHHRTNKSMRSFFIGWNILAGIPLLMPSYFFNNHMAHHNLRQFATGEDCEYVALGRRSFRHIFYFLSQVFVQPIFAVLRCLIGTPISLLHPKLRRWMLEHASSFVFVFDCDRKISNRSPFFWWLVMDVMCFLRASAIFVTVAVGANPWYRPLQIYALAVFTLSLHYLRSLSAHNYLGDGKRMDFKGQLLDSINIKGVPILTELLYPIGLRYHALHHLFPTMPYHNLKEAHRRLMLKLPEDSVYRQVEYPTVWSVLRELYAHARHNSKNRLAGGG